MKVIATIPARGGQWYEIDEQLNFTIPVFGGHFRKCGCDKRRFDSRELSELQVHFVDSPKSVDLLFLQDLLD